MPRSHAHEVHIISYKGVILAHRLQTAILCLRSSSPSIRLDPACTTLRRLPSVLIQPVALAGRTLPPYSASACVPSLSSPSSRGTCTRDFLRFTPATGGGAATESAEELDVGTLAAVSSDFRGAVSDAELERLTADGGGGGGSGLRIFLHGASEHALARGSK